MVKACVPWISSQARTQRAQEMQDALLKVKNGFESSRTEARF